MRKIAIASTLVGACVGLGFLQTSAAAQSISISSAVSNNPASVCTVTVTGTVTPGDPVTLQLINSHNSPVATLVSNLQPDPQGKFSWSGPVAASLVKGNNVTATTVRHVGTTAALQQTGCS